MGQSARSNIPLDGALAPRDAGRVLELRAELLTMRLGGESFFESFLPALRDLLGTEAVCAYGLRQLASNTQEVSFHHVAGAVLSPRFPALFSRFVEASGVEWAGYNPGRPEPAQRNRVVRLPWVTMADRKRIPIALELFPTIGVGGKDQFRVLVCEGESLLGWVGGWQAGDCDAHQSAILTALVPALQRRLATERQLEQGSRVGVLASALEAIGKAAFVCDASGRIREANGMARALLAVEGRAVRAELGAAVRAPYRHRRWEVTPVRTGASTELLVLARAPAGLRLSAQVKRATQSWGLSPRQAAVLERVAEGNANRSIGAMLGISERTVEVHVTALLEKAQAENRAELIAKVYLLE